MEELFYFKFNRYIADMSLLYYVLGDSLSKVHTADIGEETKVDGNTMILKNNLYIVHLKRLIWENIKKNYSEENDSSDLELWKVECRVEELEELKKAFHDGIIEEKLGESLNSAKKFTNVFPNALEERIQIIVHPPPPASTGFSRETTYDTEKILRAILKDLEIEVPKEKTKETTGLLMPLKERDTGSILRVITDNAYKALFPLTSKTDFNFLVCGGAPGIGKTRWGIELFESLKRDWTPPSKWTDTKPHFLYFLLDFVNGVRLSEFDQKLSASIIIGLRIAYKFFAQDKMSFDSFKYAALTIEESLSAFNINLVLDRIRKSLKLESKQQLIILLHIDEYQEIIDYDQNERWRGPGTKGIFKEILNETGKLMSTGARIDYFVQTLLSGTALREATKKFEPTSYSFEFVECPLLTTVAMLEIVDYYANENGDKQQGWMSSAPYLQILYDTGGLPRALQYVLEKSISTENFFDQLKEGKFTFFDDIFSTVADTLNKKYGIRDFVQKNKNVSYQLLYHCICDIPVKLEQILDTDNSLLTVEKLERDGYLILKTVRSSYFIQMPFYFVYLYNLELNIAPGILHGKFQPDPNMCWHEWERFVAQFEVFYNNLLLDIGIEEISLRDYYRGAFGKKNILDIRIRLKKLDICEIKNQFPKTSQLIRRVDNTIMSLESDYVFINGNSASFADAFIARSKDIIRLQQKWHNSFDFISIQDIEKECKKNDDAINIAKRKKMKSLEDFRVIPIIFTSQQFNEADINNLPDKCLVIAKNNFGQYFGKVFSSRLAFSMLNDFNLNFATPDQISKMFGGIGPIISSQICKKRPYYDADDLINKNKNYSNVKKVKTELEKCSYAPHSIIKKSHDIRLVFSAEFFIGVVNTGNNGMKIDGKMVDEQESNLQNLTRLISELKIIKANSIQQIEKFSTEDDTKASLGGILMVPRFLLNKYFTGEDFKDNVFKEAIRIIVQVLATTDLLKMNS
ncbi:hypothetical protein GLOIN_2v1720049 [Rhizophagus clarus]|uniref:Crinkler effector protein N-terminal domain-containing protein n=1 Tax=Rhizophagus clarus TaxID=94130 RepID=A0A8H3QC23_9GLOM|nr:hypothetical protein GLOIN_2v1720049 [Rhizophagus clarus]